MSVKDALPRGDDWSLNLWSSPSLAMQRNLALLASLGIVALAISVVSCRDANEMGVAPSDASVGRSTAMSPIIFELNHCSWQQLSLFPGVSRTLATRIVEVRDSIGGFRSWHDLQIVPGIGEKKMRVLQKHPQLTLLPAPRATGSLR